MHSGRRRILIHGAIREHVLPSHLISSEWVPPPNLAAGERHGWGVNTLPDGKKEEAEFVRGRQVFASVP
eukprot:226315-Amphidinium_carterae.1